MHIRRASDLRWGVGKNRGRTITRNVSPFKWTAQPTSSHRHILLFGFVALSFIFFTRYLRPTLPYIQAEEQMIVSYLDEETARKHRMVINFVSILERARKGDYHSDTAYLEHCDLHQVNYSLWGAWAQSLLLRTGIKKIGKVGEASVLRLGGASMVRDSELDDILEELTLELMEVHSAAFGYCDFTKYQPTVVREKGSAIDKAERKLKAVLLGVGCPPDLARLAIVVRATDGAAGNLSELVNAVHMSHHLIVIHMQRRATRELQSAVSSIARKYDNVAVVTFGSVAHGTDQATDINLRIMRWLRFDLGLQYDYHVNTDGEAYPLLGAKDLAATLKREGRKVYLGEMFDEGKRITGPDLALRLSRPLALTYSRGSGGEKYMGVSGFKRGHFGRYDVFELNKKFAAAFIRKSTSGNQAIYHTETVDALLASADAMEVFAHMKYGCCSGIDESNWNAALNLVGLSSDAEKVGAVWQALGGSSDCEATLSNAVLSTKEESCYIQQDRVQGSVETSREVRGSDLFDELKDAKRRGYLFARRFDSSERSIELRKWIANNLHES